MLMFGKKVNTLQKLIKRSDLNKLVKKSVTKKHFHAFSANADVVRQRRITGCCFPNPAQTLKH